jgi:hypothetical protein
MCSSGRARRAGVVQRFSQGLTVREFHVVAVRIMDDAEIPGIRIQQSGAKLQESTSFSLIGNFVYGLSRRQGESKMTDRA